MAKHWSVDEMVAKDYEQRLRAATLGRFATLRHVSSALTGGHSTDDQLIGRVVNVYGVVDAVNTYNDMQKRVQVVDPTVQTPITFIINNINTNIVTKNIIRLTGVVIVTSITGKMFAVNERKNFAQFHAFTYDYESTDPNRYDIFTANATIEPMDYDRPVCLLLEQWFAHTFLRHNSFDTLFRSPAQQISAEETDNASTAATITHNIADKYVDFACLVMASQLYSQSILLTCYDGSQPTDSVHNQRQINYEVIGAELPANRYHRLNNMSFLMPYRMDPKKLVFVNVWKNRSNQHNDHFDVAEGTTLMNGDDLLILFNVEITRSPEDRSSVTLHLRSGRHYGKGVRKVHRNSILGRLLLARIGDRERKVDRAVGGDSVAGGDAIDDTVDDDHHSVHNNTFVDDMNETLSLPPLLDETPIVEDIVTVVDEPLATELLALGCRRLQNLYNQQIREKDFPPVYRNSYKYNLKDIEKVLAKSRQLSRFPAKRFLGSVGQCRLIEDLESLDTSVTSDGAQQSLFLIRAKIVDLLPHSVFPVKQFVIVRCPVCLYSATVKTLEHQIGADECPLDECPDCGQQSENIAINHNNNSYKLQHFYAIVFFIKDSNCDTTRVCLRGNRAVDVLTGGFDARDLLDDPEAALQADNTLWNICDTSDRYNGVDWIIRRSDATTGDQPIHEVVSIAPLNTYS
ncbi:unnamed protein product [Medioppia subpectinata]|uniref:Uncharacterized protein n=1 Tax=Medioppia subpectinata TaxID=1979941 RepID=A0A7R9KLN2_9ACAR|nr:unnamed protein product [Medioppia subpectinata]CAG2105884.1 unnamed protein product [Medioppia subpectinata]